MEWDESRIPGTRFQEMGKLGLMAVLFRKNTGAGPVVI